MRNSSPWHTYPEQTFLVAFYITRNLAVRAVSSRVSWMSLPDVYDMHWKPGVKTCEKGRGKIAVIWPYKTEFPQTSCYHAMWKLSYRNQTFDWVRFTNRSAIERSIGKILLWVGLGSIEFGNRTIGVRLPNCSIRYPGLFYLRNFRAVHSFTVIPNKLFTLFCFWSSETYSAFDYYSSYGAEIL